MSNSAIHCPFCDATKAAGLGLVVYEASTLVEYRCTGCGELFFCCDRREQALVPIGADADSASEHLLSV